MAEINPADFAGMDEKAMMAQQNMMQLAHIQAMQDQYMKLQQACEEWVKLYRVIFYRGWL